MRFRPNLEPLQFRMTPSVPGLLSTTPIAPMPITLTPIVPTIPLTYSTITVAQLVPPDELFD